MFHHAAAERKHLAHQTDSGCSYAQCSLLSKLVCACVCVQRSRKRSSADVHQKGSRRQRRKSVLQEVCPIIKAIHLVLNALKDVKDIMPA
jgi:hypothetical protein